MFSLAAEPSAEPEVANQLLDGQLRSERHGKPKSRRRGTCLPSARNLSGNSAPKTQQGITAKALPKRTFLRNQLRDKIWMQKEPHSESSRSVHA